MKGYLVKYSTGYDDDYFTHDIRVYLDLKEAVRYMEKFNSVISKAKDFYRDGCKDYHSVSLEELCDKFEFYNDISEPWVEEIEIVDVVKKRNDSRWD